MGIEKKEGPKALYFSCVKISPNFQWMCVSTAKDFFRFIRSWKIVVEFMRLTMVV
jgi:hypothetical protein